jgi:RecA DNA recombination protein
MSSAVVSTSAALGRPFLFDAEPESGVCLLSGGSSESTVQEFQSTIKNQPTILHLGNRQSKIENVILPASRLAIRPAPEMVTSGIPALDALTGGLPRGCLTEIYGPASSGRTSVMLAALAIATRRGEYCAVIDASDSLDHNSLFAVGVDLDRLLWVRCNENSPQRHPSTSLRAGSDTEKNLFKKKISTNQSEHRLEQVLRATDLLLESGSFGLIILDLSDIPHQSARRIPLTTWFRFRRAVEHKPTILLAIEQQPIAGSCSSLLLQLGTEQEQALSEPATKRRNNAAHGASRGSDKETTQAPDERKKTCVAPETIPISFPLHTHLLTELKIHVELIRSRLDRKPARSVSFESKTAWAG